MNTKLEMAFFILAGIAILIGAIWIVVTEKRLKRFFLGKKGKDLEDTIVALENDIVKLKKAKENIEKDVAVMTAKLKKSIRGVETIRFNPFKGTGDGGNQSFSTTLINEKGDGVVVSSLYSRDRVSVFSKPIKKFESSFELTEEERATIANSKESLK